MNKIIAALLLTFPLIAFGGGYGDDRGCRGHSCNDGGGGDVDVRNDNDNYNRNNNHNRNSADADARANSHSSSDASATSIQGQAQQQQQQQQQNTTVGNVNIVNVDLPEGAIGTQSTSTTTASGGRGGQGGSAHASGGEGGSANIGDVSTGPATANNSGVSQSTGDTNVSTGDVSSGDSSASTGDLIVYGDDYERPASASAASVFAAYCQSGGSGQNYDGGFSVINESQFCDHVKAAGVFYEAYTNELDRCQCEESEQALEYYAAYQDNLNDANDLVQWSKTTGFLDRLFGGLVRPLAVIAGIVFLL